MSLDLFRRRARRFEWLARRSRVLYRFALVLLVALGYTYVVGVTGVILLLTVGLTGLLLAGGWVVLLLGTYRNLEPAVALARMVARALWVRIDPPDGIAVTREGAPALFAMVDELRATLRTRRVHHVLVTAEVNAAMTQVPRFGIFGWYRNYLSLGLPLLQGLSPGQARAVVAHELAHLSARHSRMGAWTYRVRETWHRLVAELERDGARAGGPFGAFFRWYIPLFDALTLVESRENELEADRLTASAAGADVAAQALVRIAVLARHDEEVFWPAFGALAAEYPAPPHGPFAARLLPAAPAPAADWVRERLDAPEDAFATHPSLRARLEALGVAGTPAEALETPSPTAADALLGPLAPVLTERLDGEWVARAARGWREAHEEIRAERAQLEALERAAAERALDTEEALKRAWLRERHGDPGAALPLYAAAAAAWPEHPEARFHYGRVLLDGGDEAGLAHLEAAAGARDLVAPAAQVASAWLRRAGRGAQADAWRRRGAAVLEEDEAAHEERRGLRRRERMAPHTAASEEVEKVREVLRWCPRLRRAYLVRRVLRHRPDVPAHLLVLDLRRIFGEDDDTPQVLRSVADKIDFPDTWIVSGDEARLLWRASRVPGSLVYRRDRDG